ncbi:MAG: hypothetical protein WCE38_11830 [Burkholderiales bacterium]
METTATPFAKQTISTSHMNALHPRSASRRSVLHTVVRHSTTPDMRQRVGQAFRDMAHGVPSPLAAAQTKAFYRSSGQDWAHSLTAHGGDDLRARVVGAFRFLANGARDTAAHARTVHFYRLGGQSWAKNLG